MLVSFSGLDGAGKTFQTETLAEHCRATSRVELMWAPFDIWPSQLLRLLPMAVRRRLGPQGRTEAVSSDLPSDRSSDRPSNRPSNRPSDRPRSPGLLLKVFWVLVATGASVSAALNLRRQVRGLDADIVILDRYRIDTIVKLRFWYPTVPPGWIAGIVTRLSPVPDVEFLLRVEPGVAYARKPEQYSVAQLTHQARLYDEVVLLSPCLRALDAEDDPAELAAVVTAQIDPLLSRG